MMKNREIKDFAWRQLKGNWGAAILVLLVCFILISIPAFGITFAVTASMLLRAFSVETRLLDFFTGPAGGILIALGIVLFIGIGMVMGLGMTRMFLRLVRGQRIRFPDLFQPFRNPAEMKNYAYVYLINLGVAFLLMLPEYIVQHLFGRGSADLIIVQIICRALGFVFGLFVLLAPFAAAEAPERRAIECFRISLQLMKGRKLKYLGLLLSFVPWLLLCMITCGLAYFVTVPYLFAAQCIFYLSAYGEEYLSGRRGTPDSDSELPHAHPEGQSVRREEAEPWTQEPEVPGEEPAEQQSSLAGQGETPQESAAQHSWSALPMPQGHAEDASDAADAEGTEASRQESSSYKTEADGWESYERWKRDHRAVREPREMDPEEEKE